MGLRVLYVGENEGTCLQRARALEELGHRVHLVDSGPPRSLLLGQIYRIGQHLSRPPDLLGAHRRLREALDRERFDVLWVDKGRSLKPSLLAEARERAPHMRLVSYSPDDMTRRYHSSVRYRASLRLFDLVVTTKSYIVEDLRRLGARRVVFVGNAYDPTVHRPLDLSPPDRERFACDVGFAGTFEEDRSHHLLGLARAGIPVTIRGHGWRRFRESHRLLTIVHGHMGQEDYVKAINAARINLGFLRKGARDRQTTRSVEIPGCRAFMLAERTDEHLELFEEGVEAEFFDSFDELLSKCRYYLQHEDERRQIAAAGYERCLRSRYRNRDRLQDVLEALEAETVDE
jgi:spore maturation protein CgeB